MPWHTTWLIDVQIGAVVEYEIVAQPVERPCRYARLHVRHDHV
jgi:hypothetical protein